MSEENLAEVETAPEQVATAAPETEVIAPEAARQVIRDKYATMQTAIDAASTTNEIKAAMP